MKRFLAWTDRNQGNVFGAFVVIGVLATAAYLHHNRTPEPSMSQEHLDRLITHYRTAIRAHEEDVAPAAPEQPLRPSQKRERQSVELASHREENLPDLSPYCSSIRWRWIETKGPKWIASYAGTIVNPGRGGSFYLKADFLDANALPVDSDLVNIQVPANGEAEFSGITYIPAESAAEVKSLRVSQRISPLLDRRR